MSSYSKFRVFFILAFFLLFAIIAAVYSAFRYSENKMEIAGNSLKKNRPNNNFNSIFSDDGYIRNCITNKVIGALPATMESSPLEISAKAEKLETPQQRRDSFAKIFETKVWGGERYEDPTSATGTTNMTGSGWSSALYYTQRASAGLHAVINQVKREFGLSRVRLLDVPCGDMFWMSRLLEARDDVDYTGIDIVPELIAHHRKRFAAHKNVRFLLQDVAVDPLKDSYDIIFSRFLLQVLHLDDVFAILKGFSSSGSRLLFVSTSHYIDRNAELNVSEIGPTRIRLINLEIPPIALVPPICTFNDVNENLGLWQLPLTKVKTCPVLHNFEFAANESVLHTYYSCTLWSL